MRSDTGIGSVVSGPAGFFRVFDVAFFLPGVIVVGALSGTASGSARPFPLHMAALATMAWPRSEPVRVALEGTTVVTLVFLAGLACHAVQRAVFSGFKSMFAIVAGKRPADAVRTRSECGAGGAGAGSFRMELYFWNLATLSWNLAAALVLTSVVTWYTAHGHRSGWSVAAMLGAGLLPPTLTLARVWRHSRESHAEAPVSQAYSVILSVVLVLLAGEVVAVVGWMASGGRNAAGANCTLLLGMVIALGFLGWEFRCSYWRTVPGQVVRTPGNR